MEEPGNDVSVFVTWLRSCAALDDTCSRLTQTVFEQKAVLHSDEDCSAAGSQPGRLVRLGDRDDTWLCSCLLMAVTGEGPSLESAASLRSLFRLHLRVSQARQGPHGLGLGNFPALHASAIDYHRSVVRRMAQARGAASGGLAVAWSKLLEELDAMCSERTALPGAVREDTHRLAVTNLFLESVRSETFSTFILPDALTLLQIATDWASAPGGSSDAADLSARVMALPSQVLTRMRAAASTEDLCDRWTANLQQLTARRRVSLGVVYEGSLYSGSPENLDPRRVAAWSNRSAQGSSWSLVEITEAAAEWLGAEEPVLTRDDSSEEIRLRGVCLSPEGGLSDYQSSIALTVWEESISGEPGSPYEDLSAAVAAAHML